MIERHDFAGPGKFDPATNPETMFHMKTLLERPFVYAPIAASQD